MSEAPASELERQIGLHADRVIAESKTGYNWPAVDELLRRELGLAGESRCKRASNSGRAANVLTESNDKDIELYLIFVSHPYTIDRFKNVIADRMARFVNVRAVAVADRTSGEWRVRYYAERDGEGVADSLGAKLIDGFPLLAAPEACEIVEANHDSGRSIQAPLPALTLDEETFEGAFAAHTASAGPPTCDLLREFRGFVEGKGLSISPSVLADVVACCLSGQFLLFAGPSGTGKSTMARSLAEFFTDQESFHVMEGRRQLLGPEDVGGYFSNIGQQFAIASDTVGLVGLHEAAVSSDVSRVPFLLVEEANLSAIEGYLAPIVHGLSGVSAPTLKWSLHSRLLPIVDDDLSIEIPPRVLLGPYPRVLATINVDASAPAPARKVTSRALVILLEPEPVDVASLTSRLLTEPGPSALGRGGGAGWISDPATAMRTLGEPAVAELASAFVSLIAEIDPGGRVSPSHRDLARAVQYMATYSMLVEGCVDAPPRSTLLRLAAENAFLHIVLPTVDAAGFAMVIRRMANDPDLLEPPARADAIGGILVTRVERLASTLSDGFLADSVDFWTALS